MPAEPDAATKSTRASQARAEIIGGIVLIIASFVLYAFDAAELAQRLVFAAGVGLLILAWREHRREQRIAEQAEAIRRARAED